MRQIVSKAGINRSSDRDRNQRWLCSLAIMMGVLLASRSVDAQRPRFPDYFNGGSTTAQPVQFQAPPANPPTIGQGTQLPTLGTPNLGNPPIITTTPPPNTIQSTIPGQQGLPPATPFDPFSNNSPPFPSFGTPAPQTSVPPNIQIQPPVVQNPGFPNTVVQPYNLNAPNEYSGTNSNWASQTWAKLRDDYFPRLLERPRFRHTWLAGNNGNELDINDTEVATTITFANFLGGTEALRVSPGFIWHFWGGPDTAVTGVDLPSRAYSAYIATDYISNPNNPSGIETNVAVGIYSDFDNVSSDSWRVTGTLLGWTRVNPYSTAKFGIEYFDRVDLKILPAFGVFMAPNSEIKFDLYFPRPKLAHRLPNYGDYEFWMYVGGEYGGGSWTIERLGGFDDHVDINDVRSYIGLEWVGPRNVAGFFEVGYVFDRELVFRSDDLNKTELQDTIMLRGGVAF